MFLRWTTLPVALLLAVLVCDVVFAATPLAIHQQGRSELEAAKAANRARLAQPVDAPSRAPRQLSHEHWPAWLSALELAAPIRRVDIATGRVAHRRVVPGPTPDVVARGPPVA